MTTANPTEASAGPTSEDASSGPAARARLLPGVPPALLIGVAAAVVLAVMPLLLDEFRLGLLTRYLCYAIVAVGIAVAWGRGGMLTLGHGVFFGLGAYAMAAHMTLAATPDGALPEFMVWNGIESLPLLWRPFQSLAFTLAAVVVLPGAIAALLGWAVFRRRVRGAYFAILNQALAAAFAILLIGQQHLTGGSSGLTNLPVLAGVDLSTGAARTGLYFTVAGFLLAVWAAYTRLMDSRYGALLVAVRDSEERVRFLGYDPTWVKASAYTLSAVAAGIAGALFVPATGIITPALVGVIPSIQLVLMAALGGRHSLTGAAIGAVALGTAETAFSESFAGGWLYLQGALFVVVIALAPRGLAGFAESLASRVSPVRRSR
ncbi:urea ABC transporter permease subunit UrtC [Nocardiopsis sp. RSe5-2]|uniref:Urea ABC transporter permease subunit UrtC n=1 Tax=Nocardiopsis endophytica TaxID=3018445 RepID=A0ABT4TYF1_9ACTN|nr:urea ABC transporter permease subunit UrtC [Nocardiopsis endophytica]MDA2809723.1 urea ABC transporter permease subunit UrtC [Nocardiopsis endophytica]